MSAFTKLADNFFIYGQISPSHINQASSQGIKTIVNLRPDAEKPGYLDAEDAADVAEDNNLKYHHLPIALSGPSPDQVVSFVELMQNSEGPLLVHCGSGKRAAILWALAHKDKISADEILTRCANCGHDLAMLRPYL